MTWDDRITVDDGVVGGKPVVRGTRLSVDFVLGLLAEGWSIDNLLESYPNLSAEDVRGCMAYASAQLGAGTGRR